MSLEYPRDIPRTWVEDSTPRDNWPQLQPGTVYGFLSDNRSLDPDSVDIYNPEAKRIADQIEWELAPGCAHRVILDQSLLGFDLSSTDKAA